MWNVVQDQKQRTKSKEGINQGPNGSKRKQNETRPKKKEKRKKKEKQRFRLNQSKGCVFFMFSGRKGLTFFLYQRYHFARITQMQFTTAQVRMTKTGLKRLRLRAAQYCIQQKKRKRKNRSWFLEWRFMVMKPFKQGIMHTRELCTLLVGTRIAQWHHKFGSFHDKQREKIEKTHLIYQFTALFSVAETALTITSLKIKNQANQNRRGKLYTSVLRFLSYIGT